jgi:hypothetical protein
MMGTITFALLVVLTIVLRIEHTISIMYKIINELEMGTIKECIKKVSQRKRQIISIFKKNSLQFKNSQDLKALKQSVSHSSDVS